MMLLFHQKVKLRFILGQAANDAYHDSAIGEIQGGPNFKLLNDQLQEMQKLNMIAPDTTLAVAEANLDKSKEFGNPAANDIVGSHTAKYAAEQNQGADITR